MGDPEIIILDEPTASLDPRQIVEIRRLIRSLKGKHTILLSSHILSEVAELCDVILILSEGKLVAMDTLQNLQDQFLHTDTLHITVRCTAARAESVLKKINGVQKITAVGKGSLAQLTIECPKGMDIREQVFFAFSELRCPILSMTLHEASLEEVFLNATLPDNSAPSASLKPVGRAATSSPKSKSHSLPPPMPPKPSSVKNSAVQEEEEDDYKPLFGRKEKHNK